MPRMPTADQLGQRPTPSARGGISQLSLETPNIGHESEARKAAAVARYNEAPALTGLPQAAALAEFGQAVKGLGDTFAILAQKEKRELDATRAEEATTEYTNGLMELELGEKDGFSNIRSGEAVKNPLMETYREKRTELSKKVREKLANKDQLSAFDQRAAIADRQFDSRLYRHVAEQSHIYQGAVHEGVLATERQMAALNWQQPGQIEMSVLRTNMEVERKARTDGLNPASPDDAKVIGTMKIIAETQIHANVVEQMLQQGKDSAAASYYVAVKERLTSEAIVILGSKVDAASVDGNSLRGVDSVWEILGPKNLDDPVRLDLMEGMIREQFGDDPRLVKSAISDIRSRATAHNDAQQEMRASNQAKVLDAYHNGSDLRTLQTMPEYQALDGEARNRTRDYVIDNGWTEQQRARAQNSYVDGAKASAGFRAYWELSNPSVLKGLSEAQILSLEPELGQKLTEDLMVARRKLSDSKSVVEASIDTELFNIMAAEAGLSPYKSNMSEGEKENLGRLKNRVESVIDIAQQQKGGKLSRDEKEKLMHAELDRKVLLNEWGSDPKMPAALVSTDQRGKVYVPVKEIDPEWVKGAINYMRSTGAVPIEWSDEKVKIGMKGRLERAYGISVTGGTSEEGVKALRGE